MEWPYQWMADSFPYLVFGGAVAVVWGLWWDALRRFRRWRDHKKSAIDD